MNNVMIKYPVYEEFLDLTESNPISKDNSSYYAKNYKLYSVIHYAGD